MEYEYTTEYESRRVRKRARPLARVLAAVCVLLLIGCAAAFWFLNEDKFEMSKELAKAKQFYEAKAVSALLLPSHPETKELASYINAGLLLENGEYAKAKEEFTALSGYLDADDLIKECDFRYGQQLFAEEDYVRASEVFGSLEGYGESKIWAEESVYLVGLTYYEQLRDAEEPAEICTAAKQSLALFSSIPDHENAVKMAERTSDYIYALGQEAFEKASAAYNKAETLETFIARQTAQGGGGEGTPEGVTEDFLKLFQNALQFFVLIPDYKECGSYLEIISATSQPAEIAAVALRENLFEFAPARKFIFGYYIPQFFYGYWVGGGYGIEFSQSYHFYLLTPEDGTGESYGSGGISTEGAKGWKTAYSFRILGRDSIEVIGKKTYELRRDITNQPNEKAAALEPEAS